MTDIRAAYESIGADFDDAARRFGSPALVERFAGMFLQDKSFPELEEALAAHNARAAFRAAHTLKGVALNLSLSNLAAPAVEVTEALRPCILEGVDIEPLMVPLRKAYNETVASLGATLGE